MIDEYFYTICIKNQQNLLTLISAFIIGGVFKDKKVFYPAFKFILNKVKNKKLGLLLVSSAAGILPIEGRTVVSAPILSAMMCKHAHDDENVLIRSKMGMVDYLATHHYYMWSPLEKSVIIMMGGLGISYLEFLKYTALPLAIYLSFLLAFIFLVVKEEDIELELLPSIKSDSYSIIPFLIGVALCTVVSTYIILPLVALFYVLLTKTKLWQALKYINWKAVGMVSLIIMLGNSLSPMYGDLSKNNNLGGYTVLLGLQIGALNAFLSGSSSVYSGMTVALTNLMGMQFFTFIFITEYVMYLISPVHKCIAITTNFFGFEFYRFYTYMFGLVCLLLLTGLGSYFIV